MRTSALLACGLLLGACTVGDIDGGDDDVVPGTGEVAGTITTDQTWSDAISIIAETTIAAGVTVTVEPGTEVTARNGVTLRVEGTLEVAGTADAPVSMMPASGAQTWAGVVAESGGSVRMAYAEGTNVATLLYCHAGAVRCELDHVDFVDLSQAIVAEGTALMTSSRVVDIASGGVTVRNSGNLTVRDSYVMTSTGDLVVQSGGTLLIEYSEVGDTQGSYDHCNFHINSAASLTITNTNIVNGVVGMMIGGTTNATITGNNWLSNDTDVQETGPNTAVDMTGNYWQAGAPTLGDDIDVSAAATVEIADAGPRS